jgi:hypothetical protein
MMRRGKRDRKSSAKGTALEEADEPDNLPVLKTYPT